MVAAPAVRVHTGHGVGVGAMGVSGVVATVVGMGVVPSTGGVVPGAVHLLCFRGNRVRAGELLQQVVKHTIQHRDAILHPATRPRQSHHKAPAR